MDGFTFFKSYYESAQHLNDADQALFYKLVMDYMFTGEEPNLTGHIMGFWLLAKPNLDTSKARAKSGQTKSKPNQKTIKRKSKPKPSPLEDKDKDKDIGVISKDINKEAFVMWCDYKGSKYTKQGKTLSMNKLKAFSKAIQMEMVETAIMNGWKGLFEIKKQSTFKKEAQVGSITWQLEQEAKAQKEIIDV